MRWRGTVIAGDSASANRDADRWLQAKSAAEMKMEPNLLPSFSLGEAQEVSTASRQTPNASIEAGYSHSIALCMNVAAIQTGQKVTFDDKTQQVMVGGKVYA